MMRQCVISLKLELLSQDLGYYVKVNFDCRMSGKPFEPAKAGVSSMQVGSNAANKSGTTLQSMMNAKLGQHRFWPCHENGLIKMIQTVPHIL